MNILVVSPFAEGSDNQDDGYRSFPSTSRSISKQDVFDHQHCSNLRDMRANSRSSIDIFSILDGDRSQCPSDFYPSVLIVEDELVSQRIACSLLSKESFSYIDTASTVHDAVRLYNEKQSDIILLDHDLLDGRKGSEFLSGVVLKKDSIVYATSTDLSLEVLVSEKNKNLLDGGAYYLLPKPWSRNTFASANFRLNSFIRKKLCGTI